MRRSPIVNNPTLVLADESSSDTLTFFRTNEGEPYREILGMKFETGAYGDWKSYEILGDVRLDMSDVARLRDFLNENYPAEVTR